MGKLLILQVPQPAPGHGGLGAFLFPCLGVGFSLPLGPFVPLLPLGARAHPFN